MSRLSLTLLAVGLLTVSPGYGEETQVVATRDELTFEDLFRRAAIRDIALSPDGEFVAFFRFNMLVIGRPGKGYTDVRSFADRLSIQDIQWIGPNSLWVDSWDRKHESILSTAIRFKDNGEEGFEVDDVWDHHYPGLVVDALVNDGRHVTLAVPRWEDETPAVDLYYVDVFQWIDEQQTLSNRVDTGSDEFLYYGQNANGDYTLGIRLAEGVPEIWSRLPDADDWEKVWKADRESTFIPYEISTDSKTLWVLTDTLTDRLVAAEFNLETREFGDILFEHNRVDVDGIVMSPDSREPIGATYTEQGLLQYHFFSAKHDAQFDRLRKHFPGQGIIRIGYSADADRLLLFASSPRLRGEIHVCDVTEDWCDLVDSVAPWLDGGVLNETIVFDVPSSDGIVVEAFLTLPSTTADSVPVVAMPHGGPIGISDERYFSSDVQWLAQNGYAVLQVNYRGSGGYGEVFLEAGLRQWGRGIEDDIEAAVRKVLEDYPVLDGERVGIYGASYGGYSALMSVIRNPGLFKCAASFAGVTDLTLLFTESAAKSSEFLRDTLIDYVGDPHINYAELVEHSPVYRYKDIKRPILLAHGLDDSVADFEHSWRMQKMLQLAGSPATFILLKDIGHGFSYISEAKQLYDPLMNFLDENLKAPERY